MFEVIKDTIIDTLKLIPFLWLTFYLIEVIEHKYQKKSQNIIKKSGKYGPILGGILGCFPQCGFSVMATNLYITKIISLGTLISIYLSTSDEMLPILLSEKSDIKTILSIIGVKVLIGIIAGIIIDLILKKRKEHSIQEICEHEHCHCEKGILASSIHHTLNTIIFILITSFFINILMNYGLEQYLKNIFHTSSILTPFLSSLIGLIPNCGASIILTELYLNHILSFSSLISGLLTGSGVALLVLFKNNKNTKENLFILFLIYTIGVFSGLILTIFS